MHIYIKVYVFFYDILTQKCVSFLLGGIAEGGEQSTILIFLIKKEL